MLKNASKPGDKVHITRGTYCKIYKFLQLRWYDHVERMQNHQMPNQVTTATVEGTRDRERPCKRWRGRIQEDLNVMRITKLVRDHWEWRKIILGGLGTRQTVVLQGGGRG